MAYGYGIYLDDMRDISLDGVLAMCKLTKDCYEDFCHYVLEYADMEDFDKAFDYAKENQSDFLADFENILGRYLQTTIYNVHHIMLSLMDDANCEMALLRMPQFDWNKRTQEEQSLTEDGLRQIIAKYVRMINDDNEIEVKYYYVNSDY